MTTNFHRSEHHIPGFGYAETDDDLLALQLVRTYESLEDEVLERTGATYADVTHFGLACIVADWETAHRANGWTTYGATS